MKELNMEPPFEAYMGEKPFIFVSYCHKDKSTIYPILKKIAEKGFNIWYDEGIPITIEWEKFIMEKLEQSHIVLGFVSKNVLGSENTKKELERTIKRKKTFFGIYMDKLIVPEELKEIRKWQGIEKFDMDEDTFITKLIQNLNSLMK